MQGIGEEDEYESNSDEHQTDNNIIDHGENALEDNDINNIATENIDELEQQPVCFLSAKNSQPKTLFSQ